MDRCIPHEKLIIAIIYVSRLRVTLQRCKRQFQYHRESYWIFFYRRFMKRLAPKQSNKPCSHISHFSLITAQLFKIRILVLIAICYSRPSFGVKRKCNVFYFVCFTCKRGQHGRQLYTQALTPLTVLVRNKLNGGLLLSLTALCFTVLNCF